MTTITEKTHAGAFLLTDGRPGARKQSVLLSGQNLEAGSVVGQITKVQAAAPIPTIVGTGTGAMTLLTFGDYVQTGNYVITLLATSATAAFSVVAPDGKALANGAVGERHRAEPLADQDLASRSCLHLHRLKSRRGEGKQTHSGCQHRRSKQRGSQGRL